MELWPHAEEVGGPANLLHIAEQLCAVCFSLSYGARQYGSSSFRPKTIQEEKGENHHIQNWAEFREHFSAFAASGPIWEEWVVRLDTAAIGPTVPAVKRAWKRWKPIPFMRTASWRSQEVCVFQGKCKYKLPPPRSRKLETLRLTQMDCDFFFYKRVSERREMLEVALLYTIKLYLCAKTSNWCCSIKYSKHLLPALSNVSQNSESWNFIVLLVRRASHWEQMPSLSS